MRPKAVALGRTIFIRIITYAPIASPIGRSCRHVLGIVNNPRYYPNISIGDIKEILSNLFGHICGDIGMPLIRRHLNAILASYIRSLAVHIGAMLGRLYGDARALRID